MSVFSPLSVLTSCCFEIQCSLCFAFSFVSLMSSSYVVNHAHSLSSSSSTQTEPPWFIYHGLFIYLFVCRQIQVNKKLILSKNYFFPITTYIRKNMTRNPGIQGVFALTFFFLWYFLLNCTSQTTNTETQTLFLINSWDDYGVGKYKRKNFLQPDARNV